MTATRAFCVRMLTRTCCWRRRRYLLERTCLHLLAPLDSRLLLAASVKVKILFPFFFSFKKGMSTFVVFTGGTASLCTASAWVLGKTWWPRVKTIWKGVCLAQLTPKFSADNTNCIASFSWKDGVWYEKQNPSIYSLLVQNSPIEVFTSLVSPCDIPFGCPTYRSPCSNSHTPFPCFCLPRDVSFSSEIGNNCNACSNQEFQPLSQEIWVWALLSVFGICMSSASTTILSGGSRSG